MKKILITSIISSLILSISCSEEVDINAEWENIPVIYALLNQNEDTHYIKLNKAFLGDAAAQDMAAVSDSLFYDNAIVKLQQYKNSQLVNTFFFNAVDSIPKEDETNPNEMEFATDRNTIYLHQGNIDATDNAGNFYDYQVEVKLPDSDITCYNNPEINLIEGARITKPISQPQAQISINNDNGQIALAYETGKNGNVYQMVMQFHWFEVNTNTGDTIIPDPIEFVMPSKTTTNLNQEIEMEISVEQLFEEIVETIPVKNNFKRFVRYPETFTFKLYAADENFRIYSEVNGASFGPSQEKPSFTNVQYRKASGEVNNAQGLVAARYKEVLKKNIKLTSVEKLATDSRTNKLNFAHSNDSYYN